MGDKTDIQFSLDDKCSTENILFINNIPLSIKEKWWMMKNFFYLLLRILSIRFLIII